MLHTARSAPSKCERYTSKSRASKPAASESFQRFFGIGSYSSFVFSFWLFVLGAFRIVHSALFIPHCSLALIPACLFCRAAFACDFFFIAAGAIRGERVGGHSQFDAHLLEQWTHIGLERAVQNFVRAQHIAVRLRVRPLLAWNNQSFGVRFLTIQH